MNTAIKERTRNKFGQLAQDFFVFKALKQEHNWHVTVSTTQKTDKKTSVSKLFRVRS